MGYFCNQHDVEVVYSDEYIALISIFPEYIADFQTSFLGIVYECEKIARFIKDFNLKSVEDFEAINHDSLAKMYSKGKADIVCRFDSHICRGLYFKKEGDKLYAKDDEENGHYVPGYLNSLADFENYTFKYYLLKATL